MPTDTPAEVNLLDLIRVGGLFTAGFVLFATWLIVRLVTAALTRLGDQFAHRRLLLNQAATLARFAVWIGGLVVAAALSFNLSKEVLLAIGGTAAVTIGFALKDLAASVLAGIIIIVDRPFQVGDRVSFNGTYGEIQAIGLRSVQLVTLDDNVVSIPNNKFLTDIVASGNWGALEMLIQIDFLIGADQDFSKAKHIVGEALTTCRYVSIEKPWQVLVSQAFQGNVPAIRIRSQGYVLDVKYEKDFETDVTERALEGFRQHGIQAPAVFRRSTATTARERSRARRQGDGSAAPRRSRLRVRDASETG